MSYTQVSICPICGAPIYTESPWSDTFPPPTIRSCSCFRDPLQTNAQKLRDEGREKYGGKFSARVS